MQLEGGWDGPGPAAGLAGALAPAAELSQFPDSNDIGMPLGSRKNRTATLTEKEVTCIHST